MCATLFKVLRSKVYAGPGGVTSGLTWVRHCAEDGLEGDEINVAAVYVRARGDDSMNWAVKVPYEDALRPLFSYKSA